MPTLAEPTARRRVRPAPADPPPAPPRVRPQPGGRATLAGVTWGQYAAFRDDPANDGRKLTYDGPAGGLLEIETPGELHEATTHLLGLLISAFAEERRVALRAEGATTWNRKDLARGLEGDQVYYIARFDAVRGRRVSLDDGDPPPDLAVEIDVSNPGVSKLPIYAALGVPEVWVWADGAIAVRRLNDAGDYQVVDRSAALPGFPLALAAALLERWTDAAAFELLAEFRGAVRGD